MKGIVIQARFGSTRLPGKVLRTIDGRSLLEILIGRLRRVVADRIVLATSDLPGDDPVAAEGLRLGVRVVRGPEHDVLARFISAIETENLTLIARITGDSPLLDPATVDLTLQRLEAGDVDYVSTAINGGYPLGMGAEAFTAAALQRANREARAAWDREHVTTFFKRPDTGFAVAGIPRPEGPDIGHLRWTVDTPADLERVTALYRVVTRGTPDFSLADLARADPSVPAINNAPEPTALRLQSSAGMPTVVLRADADLSTGFGHLERCLNLAHAIRGKAHVIFALRGDPAAARRVKSAGFDARFLDASSNLVPDGWFNATAPGPKILVMDVSYNLDELRRQQISACLSSAARSGVLTVLLDGAGAHSAVREGIFAGDILVAPYPGIPARKLGATTQLLGLDYVILPPQPPQVRPPDAACPNVVLTFGGSDPRHFTEAALEVLAGRPASFNRILVVLGPAFGEARCKSIEAAMAGKLEFYRSPASLLPILAEADLGLGATGLTKYEMAAVGLPSILLSIDQAHDDANRAFAALGTAHCLPYKDPPDLAALGAAIDHLHSAYEERARMSAAGRKAVDGRGAERIVGAILEKLK